jgi:hypothetical protein
MSMIGPELAAFLQEGVGIQIGTRNAALEPNAARVVAVSVDDDGQHLTAFVPEIGAARVIADLRDNGLAALVFARPPDERACQVKGTSVDIRPARAEDEAFVASQWGRWLDRLTTIGYPRTVFAHWTIWPCVAIRVRVTALFNQTPGPNAGAALA